MFLSITAWLINSNQTWRKEFFRNGNRCPKGDKKKKGLLQNHRLLWSNPSPELFISDAPLSDRSSGHMGAASVSLHRPPTLYKSASWPLVLSTWTDQQTIYIFLYCEKPGLRSILLIVLSMLLVLQTFALVLAFNFVFPWYRHFQQVCLLCCHRLWLCWVPCSWLPFLVGIPFFVLDLLSSACQPVAVPY